MFRSLAIVCSVLVLTGMPIFAAEEQATIAIKVPAAVKATLDRETAGQPITAISTQTDDQNQTWYEAEFQLAGRNYHADVRADGVLWRKYRKFENDNDTNVLVTTLPEGVRKQLLSEVGTGTLQEIVKERVVYQTRIVFGDQYYQASFDEFGYLLDKSRVDPPEPENNQ